MKSQLMKKFKKNLYLEAILISDFISQAIKLFSIKEENGNKKKGDDKLLSFPVIYARIKTDALGIRKSNKNCIV